ncbi:MAG: ABC transporter permease [Sphaerobacter sp.]|nr:ABC transporter permease [Sphaerobacter sp.]
MATNTLRAEHRIGPSAVAAGAARLPNVIRSEWTKLWSVRATVWTLLAMLVVTVGLSALFASTAATSTDPAMEHMRRDPTGTSLAGISLGQIVIVVLGVMSISTEYTSGSIRTSLIAVPRRLTLLGAKALVLAPVALVTGTVTSFAAFFVGQALLATGGINADLSDPQVLRAVVGGGLFLAGNALFGFALGAVLRSTASGITVAVAVLKILPELVAQLPGTLGDWAQKGFTSNAGQQILQVTPPADRLGPWTGYLVFTIWWVVILAIAAVLMRRRDA